MDNLEERVLSVFYNEDSDEYDQNSSDYEFDADEFSDIKQQRILYWESQQALLQEILERSSLAGSKLGQGNNCRCYNKARTDACKSCLRYEIIKLTLQQRIQSLVVHIQIPRGTHEYIEVIGNPSCRKRQISYVVELEFRDQFEIAKAGNEYKNPVTMLPRTYVGKPDCLKAIVRVVCDAAKKSMKEIRKHMGPWRKGSFVIMKWSPSIERSLASIDEHGSYERQSSFSSDGRRASPYGYFGSRVVVVT